MFLKFISFFFLVFATSSFSEDDISVWSETPLYESVVGPRATGYLGIRDRNKLPYQKIRASRYLPESFDWRNFAGVLNPVRDQKQCGDSWSFAITAALESSEVVQQNKTIQDLSEQHMTSCDKNSYGCNGGFMDSADFVVRNGLTDEPSFPYVARNARCKGDLEIKSKAKKYFLIGSPTKKPSIDEIKTALVGNGPLFITVMAGGRGWSGATHDVTSCRRRGVTNHMINLVGYDKTGWIIRNSWGEDWGDKGYAHIKYNCDLVAEEAGFIVSDVP